jgi:AAA domain, putative AbiEii toxin, Type IV TA system
VFSVHVWPLNQAFQADRHLRPLYSLGGISLERRSSANGSDNGGKQAVSQIIRLPVGEVLDGDGPIVVVGPNGGGKTRQTRQMTFPGPVEFINALRNTRVAPELPAMGTDTARQHFDRQKNQSRSMHWELEADFDQMLTQMLAEQSTSAMDFQRSYRADPLNVTLSEPTPLMRLEDLWAQVYPGRELRWREFKPVVISQTSGSRIEYTANQMSDGEKAVLYVAGRVFTAAPGVLVVDEPETHLHSLLAVTVWNALEEARPDIRFVYITHDLTFALSRRNAQYVLANPLSGLRRIDLNQELPSDVTEEILGSASLSFYASRIVFCEGESTSLDSDFYNSWFSGPDTVVRAVGNCYRVIRCVDALAHGGIASALTVVGIIDGDFYPDEFKSSLSAAITVLQVHEVESLFCLPEVVAAVCSYVSRPFDENCYRNALAARVSDAQRHQIIIERWKRRMEPNLEGLVSNISKRDKPVDDLINDLPTIFDHQRWSFSPEAFLREERTRVESAIPSGSIGDILSIAPGKQFLHPAAIQAGMTVEAYSKLIISALRDESGDLQPLSQRLEIALSDYLPARPASVAGNPLTESMI